MLAIIDHVRPKRSARIPNRIPPAADDINVRELRNPPVAAVIPKCLMISPNTIAYISTSMLSRTHPNVAAISTRRCEGEISDHQLLLETFMWERILNKTVGAVYDRARGRPTANLQSRKHRRKDRAPQIAT